ncbi:MAG TPA: hypothetical protein VF883_04020 [Thermoanaerobaculia bacterium]|jgi:hypothetical protein
MRIQETNTILKESRYARNAAAQHHHHDDHHEGMMSRTWRMVSSKLAGFFKK